MNVYLCFQIQRVLAEDIDHLSSQKPQIVVSKVYAEVKTNTSRSSSDIKGIQAEMGEEVAAQLPQQPVLLKPSQARLL